jgi:hypothetical protein
MKSLEDILALLDEYKVLLRHDGAVGAGHLAQMCEKIGRTPSSNLVMACYTCNTRKHPLSADEFLWRLKKEGQ